MELKLALNSDFERFRLRAEGTFPLDGVTALFGPSGAGKTTVLNAIGGFQRGLGFVEFDGSVWDGDGHFVPPYRRPVGTVFQDGRLFEHLTVRGNLQYALKRGDAGGPSIDISDVIDAIGLEPLLTRRPATLSGGETKRVAIARALLARPRLLLMDEPLAAIDRVGKMNILHLVRELPKTFGVPVLYVSHLVEEIVQVSERLIAIRDGQFVDQGDTATMLESLGPEVTGHFEAGALIEGRVIEHDDNFAMSAIATGGGPLWVPDAGAIDIGELVRVRLRARDVSIALNPLGGVSIRNQLPAVILEISEEPGAHAEVRMDCGGATIRARLTRMAVHDLGLVPGKEVHALIKSVAFDRRLG